MKKQMFVMMVAIALVALFSTAASAGIADTARGDEISVARILDGVVTKGGGINLDSVAQTLKQDIVELGFDFYQTSGDGYNYYFTLPVIDGQYKGEFTGIVPGNYEVNVYAFDDNSNVIFDGHTSVSVSAGKTSVLEVWLELADLYNYQFAIDGLPGEYWDWGPLNVTVDNGGEYTAYYLGLDAQGRPIFSALLPFDFERGYITVQNTDGKWYSALLQFDFYAMYYGGGEPVYQPFINMADLGSVEVTIRFACDKPE
ncbi:MAG: hypothetical protein AAB358_01635 [Patescibacteria group bacterium]